MAFFGRPENKVPDKEKKTEGEGEGGGAGGEKATEQFVTAEQLAEMKGEIKGMLDTAMQGLNLKMETFGQPRGPAPPPKPAGPTLEEEVAELDKSLASLDEPYEEAVRKGEGVLAIQKKREQLIQKRADLIHSRDINELKTYGTFAIDRLTDEVVGSKLELLRIPEVKQSYEAALNSMAPDQRMNPETRLLAYKFACGEHMDKIFDLKLQEHLRKEEETKTNIPTGGAGREHELSKDDPNYVPKPEDVLTKDNLAALRRVGKTVDGYYKQMGYDGWADFWKKDGKAYFEGEEGE